MKFFIVFLQLSLFCGLSPSVAQGLALKQLSTDPDYYSTAKSGIDAIYNWQFKEAKAAEKYFLEKYPEHPTGYFMKSMRIYWDEYPLKEDSKAYEEHMRLLNKTYDLAEEIFDDEPENKDAVLFKLMAKSVMIRNYDSYNKVLKAVGGARDIYKLMLQAIEMKENYVEFYFPSGLYNYYREYYPEEYPVYKPFMIFFRSGDKELGLKELNLAVKKSVFTYPEAASYLSKIYFYLEKERDKGLAIFRKLLKRYPENDYFILGYLKALADIERYKALKNYVDESSNRPYFKMGFATFRGLYLLNEEKDYSKAKLCFDEALELDKKTHGFGSAFYHYIYLGLSDYWGKMGDEEKMNYYKKKAKKEKD